MCLRLTWFAARTTTLLGSHLGLGRSSVGRAIRSRLLLLRRLFGGLGSGCRRRISCRRFRSSSLGLGGLSLLGSFRLGGGLLLGGLLRLLLFLLLALLLFLFLLLLLLALLLLFLL